jgi:hypothetical protein
MEGTQIGARVPEAAMTPRSHRRNLVVWNQSVASAGRYDTPRPTRTRRLRRRIRAIALLAVVGLMRVARAVRSCWRPLLAGGVLTVGGALLAGGAGGAAVLVGVMFLILAPLMASSPSANRKRRPRLERELAGYSTPADRSDLAAILDRYPDDVTCELRDILASQAMTADDDRFPAIGRY